MTSPPSWLTTGIDHVWLPYTQMKGMALPTPVKATQGCRIMLDDGRELIDGCSSWWTACHGYNHPHILEAIRAQLNDMPHVMFGGLANEPAYRLATRLASLAPGDLNRVFLAESGSVAVEVAMKMAMQYWINQGKNTHKKFVYFDHAYHGDTLGTMAVCDPEEGMHHMFKGALQNHHMLPLPSTEETRDQFEKFLKTHTEDLAAVILEPLVQGAGGMKFHDEGTLRFIRQVTDHHNVLLILDEIMTGFGRTGTLFAAEAAGIAPDIMTISKALTGGVMPLSAAISSDKVSAAFFSEDPDAALMHGPTFMGHALACAAANASLDLFEQEPRLEQVAAIEQHFKTALTPAQNIKGVADMRVRGAIGVIQVEEMRDLAWLKQRFLDKGVFIRPFGDIIYAMPPFVISPDELAQLTDAMVEVTQEWSARCFN